MKYIPLGTGFPCKSFPSQDKEVKPANMIRFLMVRPWISEIIIWESEPEEDGMDNVTD